MASKFGGNLDTWKEYIACLKGATGNCKTFQAPSVGPTAASFSTKAGGNVISGNIIITQVSIDTDIKGAVTFTSDFLFTGAITIS